ncbi:pseudouridine synthase [uncultured Zoogloea sp.]|uniref:pseudouridine synthase n=1 Tax=uncultured Zoogloea sp. TaxID=160237 RepID=UPI002631D8C1|nr:pseudouridine synthase [uncultured Zoogloea sp.]
MTDTPRRRAPLPTSEGTLKLKPRTAAPATHSADADPAPAKRGGGNDWRKRSKASYPDQANAEPPRRSRADDARPPRDDRPRDDRPPRPAGDRPARPFGDRPARPYGERSADDRGPRRDDNRPPRTGDDRPQRPYGDKPRGFGDRPARPSGDRPARPYGERSADDRGPRRDDNRPPRTGDDRPPRPYGDKPRGFGDRPQGERSAERPATDRPPRHERKQWTGEPRPAPQLSPLRDDGSIRLSKRMTELGLCSRREADEYIEKGWVRVDGRVVSELGSRVHPGQVVELDRRGQTAQDSRVTILLNKPVGYVSGQAEDGYQPASVLITAENRWAEDPSENRYLHSHHRGLAPAGRLDIDSIGLLVFTQDGRIARALIGDDSSIEKEYHVRVEGTLSEDGLKLLNHGLSLDGEALRPAKVSWLNEDQLRFVLREGKKRQIRRMCELVGLKVVGLKRVRIGRVMLGHLPPGQWRYLGADELF